MPKIIEDIVIRNQEEGDTKKSPVNKSSSVVEDDILSDSNFIKDRIEKEKEHMQEPLYKTNRPKYRPLREETSKKKGGIWFFAGIAVVALLFGLGTILSEAKVVVYPKKADVSLSNDTFSASLNKGTDTTVGYQYIALSDSLEKEIKLEKSEERQTKASGKIIVYNEYSSAPQKLIATTRFEAEDGLVYMINDPITVPGTTTKNGVVTPGSIEVTVYAEKEGESYNKEPSDFTIPGFKGTAKYTKFYARSNGSITGGSTGTVYFLDEEESTTKINELKNELEQKIKAKLSSEIPEDMAIFDTATVFSYENIPSTIESKTPDYRLSISGNLGVYAFQKDDLAMQIAKRLGVLSDSISEGVTLYDVSGLSVTPSIILTKEAPEQWSFNISGNVSVVSKIDELDIARGVAGKKRKDAKNKMSEFVSVERADIILSPFWKTRLPESAEDIVVEIKP